MKEDLVNPFAQLEHKPDLLQQVLDQLYKDTGLTELELPWEEENPDAYLLFHHKLCRQIEQLLQSNRSKLMRLLYRVDVHETHYRKALEIQNQDARTNKLANLLLNRVLQKVFTRIHYDPLK